MNSEAKAGFIILVCGILGALMALIEQMAYDNNYLLTSSISSNAELIGLQVMSIIFALLIGGILAAVTQG